MHGDRARAPKNTSRLCSVWEAKRAHRTLRATILNWSVGLDGQTRRAGFVGLAQLFSDQKRQF